MAVVQWLILLDKSTDLAALPVYLFLCTYVHSVTNFGIKKTGVLWGALHFLHIYLCFAVQLKKLLVISFPSSYIKLHTQTYVFLQLAKEETVLQSILDRLTEIKKCSGMETNAGEN
jgi:hypothetical protein